MKYLLSILGITTLLISCNNSLKQDYPKTGSVDRLDPSLDQIIEKGVQP